MYRYDAGGRVKKVTDPRGNATTYTYDGFGQLWERKSPDTGTTTYSYASDGQLQGYSRADGTLITYTYDSLGRPTAITTGTQTRHMAYDSCTNGIGRVCSVSDATGTTSYAYDPQGDITRRQFTVGSMTYALGYSYDSSGRLATFTYPDGNQASYHYQYGRLSGITATVNGSTKTVANGLTYRGGDRLLTSWTAGNGLVNSYTYDSDGRLTGIQVPGIQSLGFTYDAAANLITDITNGIHPSLTQAFTYDKLSRLIQIASPAGNQSFVYDANGNRTSHTVNGVKTPSVIQPDSNRLASVGGQAIGYDANGNTTTVGGVVKYHYDSFNRLESAGGATFTINPEGQRLRKSGPAGTTYFAPDRSGQLLADEPDGVWKDYVWMGGRMVGMITNSTVYALHSDQTGRVLVITNPSGAVAWEAEGLAFDRNTTSGNSAFFRLGFPGQYWDVDDNLWHNGYRDYDSTLGRYIESDPIGLYAGINTYAYVGGNPVSFVDIYGLCWIYSQVTGIIKHVDSNGEVDYTAKGGYSGYGKGLNNSSMQSTQAKKHGDPAGLIPRGSYSIGSPHYSPNTGPATMNLTPGAGTNMFGRSLFRIHGDNSSLNHTASQGCIIEKRSVRDLISKSGDSCLKVTL